MLSIALAVLVIGLGVKAFTASGIPLTRTKNLHGGWAKAIGALVILLGLGFVFDGGVAILHGVGSLLNRDANRAARSIDGDVTIAPDGQRDPARWTRMYAHHGDFSILFPGTALENRTGPNPAIGKVDGYSYSCAEGRREYMVVYTEFDREPVDPQLEFEKGRENVVAATKGKLLRESNRTIDGGWAREMLLELPDRSTQRIMVVFVGPLCYQILASGEHSLEDDAEVRGFFESFRLEP